MDNTREKRCKTNNKEQHEFNRDEINEQRSEEFNIDIVKKNPALTANEQRLKRCEPKPRINTGEKITEQHVKSF